jgi:O-antigen/teichoic acid export membrane protein
MLGYYALATSLATAPLMLANPIASAVFPRMTGLVSEENRNGLGDLYHKTCEVITAGIVPTGLTVALFARELIFVWTGSANAAQKAGPVTTYLVVGQLLQAAMVVPYYLALANGNVRLNLFIGIISVLLIMPLLIFLIRQYGIIGAGLSWLIMNILTIYPYMHFLHRRYLPGELRKWISRDIGRPAVAALPLVVLGKWLLSLPSSRLLAFGVIALVWIVSAVFAFSVIPGFWPSALASIKWAGKKNGGNPESI